MLNLTPFRDYLILEPLDAKTTAPGGLIIIPEAHQQKIAPQGKVLDMGPDCTCDIQIGDIVFFTLHSEYRATFKGKDYIFVPESNLIGSITETEE